MDRYVVIGNPIAHSKAPRIHAAFAAQTGSPIEFTRELVPLDGFRAAIDRLRQQGVKGASVAIPFKEQAFRLCRELSARAEAAGAVNTLDLSQPQLHGDNTDGAGLISDLVQRHRQSLRGCTVLLLGAGGAARGVILPLLAAGVERVHVANRTAERAQTVVADLQRALTTDNVNHGLGLTATGQASERAELGRVQLGPTDAQRLTASGFTQVERFASRWDLMINATSLSLDHGLPEIPASVCDTLAMAYDMVYGDRPTPYMQWARRHGAARTADGLGMLVEQAAESYWLWRGVRPQTESVYAALRAGLDPHQQTQPDQALA